MRPLPLLLGISTFALSSLFTTIVYADQPGKTGAAKANQCIGCHQIPGLRSVYPEVYHVPKITGQSAAYLESALKSYRSTERIHPSMNAIAAQLSDDDIKQLAQFYAEQAQ